jgi:type VI secretion system protein ImpB
MLAGCGGATRLTGRRGPAILQASTPAKAVDTIARIGTFLRLRSFWEMTAMAAESTQHKLDRIRKPRVHMTYDVQVGDAIQTKELPFVVGVLADLSGKPEKELDKLKDRKFIEIDRDSFNKVLSGIKPRLAFQVDNTLQGDGSKMNVELKFSHIDDFSPEAVVKQVTPLRKLLEARDKLSNLLNKMDGNDKLEELLQDVINNTESLKALGAETGRGEGATAGASTPQGEDA